MNAVLITAAIIFAGIANLLAFYVFGRLESIGHPRQWWAMQDFRLYKLYWQLAPEHGWSRLPLIMAALSVCATLLLFLASAVYSN